LRTCNGWRSSEIDHNENSS